MVIEDTEDICGKGYIVEVIDEEKVEVEEDLVEIEDKVINKRGFGGDRG